MGNCKIFNFEKDLHGFVKKIIDEESDDDMSSLLPFIRLTWDSLLSAK